MSTMNARTARKPHLCDGCHWTPSLRGVATIAPGHRYLRHTAFPGDDDSGTDSPYSVNECVACACERVPYEGPMSLNACSILNACTTLCCGDVPCARPRYHDDEHSCRRCAAGAA